MAESLPLCLTGKGGFYGFLKRKMTPMEQGGVRGILLHKNLKMTGSMEKKAPS